MLERLRPLCVRMEVDLFARGITVEATRRYRAFQSGHNHMMDRLHQLADGRFDEVCFCNISTYPFPSWTGRSHRTWRAVSPRDFYTLLIREIG